MEDAGVHRYAPLGYFVHSAAQLLSVTAPREGVAEIVFPDRVQLLGDVFDGNFSVREGDRFRVPFLKGQTRFFRIEQLPGEDSPKPESSGR
jgi:hypothetical protein